MCTRFRDQRLATLLLLLTFVVAGILISLRGFNLMSVSQRTHDSARYGNRTLSARGIALSWAAGMKLREAVDVRWKNDDADDHDERNDDEDDEKTSAGAFYQISDHIYVYSAFIDRRYGETVVRLIGMQDKSVSNSFSCRYRFSPDVPDPAANTSAAITLKSSGFSVYPDWPSDKVRYHAFIYVCPTPPNAFALPPRSDVTYADDAIKTRRHKVTFSVVSVNEKYETRIPVIDGGPEDDYWTKTTATPTTTYRSTTKFHFVSSSVQVKGNPKEPSIPLTARTLSTTARTQSSAAKLTTSESVKKVSVTTLYDQQLKASTTTKQMSTKPSTADALTQTITAKPALNLSQEGSEKSKSTVETGNGSQAKDQAKKPNKASRTRRETKPKAVPQKKDIVVCVKAVFGRPDPARLIEWIEFNRELGVNKIFIYDVATIGHARRALEYYETTDGFVEVVPFTFALQMRTLTKDDPFQILLAGGQTLLDEQAYLVALNDCFYRQRSRYRYTMIIDWDEVIVPTRPGESLVSMADRAVLEFPRAVALMLPTAWHFLKFGVTDGSSDLVAPAEGKPQDLRNNSTKHSSASNATTRPAPAYLHMQRHLMRTPVMKGSQPKPIVVPAYSLAVNWHSVTRVPTYGDSTGRANNAIPWQRFGYVHHYRKDCKHLPVECDLMLSMGEVDEAIPRYRRTLELRVGDVLRKLNLL